ncbi:hypothetical protein DFH08DRAFT_636136, partial [Mycena albidolilacea]
DPLSEDERKCESAALQEKMDATERIRFQKIRDNAAARNRLESETTLTKYWTSVNKENKPRDTTTCLQVPGSDPPVYEKRSDRMAELARDFHDNLQSKDISSEAERNEAETTVFANVKKVAQLDKAKLSQYLKRAEIVQVLKNLPNGRAPGINGLIHDLWKALHARFENSEESENKSMDIARVLTVVFNDIEMYGVHPDSNFAEGW